MNHPTAYVTLDGAKFVEGDKVAINKRHGDYEIGYIKRITPTGQIVVTSGSVERRYDANGREKGTDSFYRTYLAPVTEDIEIGILRRRLQHVNWEKASNETIKKVAELLGMVKRTEG